MCLGDSKTIWRGYRKDVFGDVSSKVYDDVIRKNKRLANVIWGNKNNVLTDWRHDTTQWQRTYLRLLVDRIEQGTQKI